MGNIQDKVTEAKAWYKSKTIIGVIIAFIPTIVKLIKPELAIDAEAVINDTFTGADLVAQNADQIWVTLVTLFGSLLAIYGRIKANLGIKPKVL